MAAAEKELGDLQVKANQAQWVTDNFITDDTEALSAELTKNLNVTIQRLAIDAKRFDKTTLPPTLRRKFTLSEAAARPRRRRAIWRRRRS